LSVFSQPSTVDRWHAEQFSVRRSSSEAESANGEEKLEASAESSGFTVGSASSSTKLLLPGIELKTEN
jgi:hypothetical protein